MPSRKRICMPAKASRLSASNRPATRIAYRWDTRDVPPLDPTMPASILGRRRYLIARVA
jgi:hypothetical protein